MAGSYFFMKKAIHFFRAFNYGKKALNNFFNPSKDLNLFVFSK